MVCHVIIQNLIGLFIHRNLFDYIDIRPENIHILNGNAHDLLAECASYETTIKKAGCVELFFGGVGPDGHIAFNEPESSLSSRTRVKTLIDDTVIVNVRFFGNDTTQVPKSALSVGVGTTMITVQSVCTSMDVDDVSQEQQHK